MAPDFIARPRDQKIAHSVWPVIDSVIRPAIDSVIWPGTNPGGDHRLKRVCVHKVPRGGGGGRPVRDRHRCQISQLETVWRDDVGAGQQRCDHRVRHILGKVETSAVAKHWVEDIISRPGASPGIDASGNGPGLAGRAEIAGHNSRDPAHIGHLIKTGQNIRDDVVGHGITDTPPIARMRCQHHRGNKQGAEPHRCQDRADNIIADKTDGDGRMNGQDVLHRLRVVLRNGPLGK